MSGELDLVMQSLAVLAHYDFEGEYDDAIDVAKILCPFHDEEIPSMWVYVQQGSAHCFGCNWDGSILKFVATIEKTTKLKALMMVSKWARVSKVQLKDVGERLRQSIRVGRVEERERFDPAQSYLNAMPALVGSESRSEYYMYGRGFLEETLVQFDVRHNGRSEWPIVMPLRRNGELVAWQSRALDNRRDKYKFTYGSNPSTLIVGQTVGKVVVVTEGYLDMMMAWQHLQLALKASSDNKTLVNAVVCTPLTWLVREKQAAQIDGGVVVLALDNDERGREGTDIAMRLIPSAVSFDWQSGAKDVGELDRFTFTRELMRAVRRRGRQ